MRRYFHFNDFSDPRITGPLNGAPGESAAGSRYLPMITRTVIFVRTTPLKVQRQHTFQCYVLPSVVAECATVF